MTRALNPVSRSQSDASGAPNPKLNAQPKLARLINISLLPEERAL
jgi:hypothetical protein